MKKEEEDRLSERVLSQKVVLGLLKDAEASLKLIASSLADIAKSQQPAVCEVLAAKPAEIQTETDIKKTLQQLVNNQGNTFDIKAIKKLQQLGYIGASSDHVVFLTEAGEAFIDAEVKSGE